MQDIKGAREYKMFSGTNREAVSWENRSKVDKREKICNKWEYEQCFKLI